MKKAAFTLIELLVVICIIALLAGIALPVFNTVLEKSRATTDASNLRQIGLGIAAYVNDNDEQIFKDGGGAAGGKTWPQALQAKYVTDWKVFKSPFDKRTDPAQQTAGSIPVSYGINVNVLTQTSGGGKWDGNTSRMASPSQLIIMAPAMTSNLSMPTFEGNDGQDVKLTVPGAVTNRKEFLGSHSKRGMINALHGDFSNIKPLRYGPSTDTDAFSNTTGTTGKQRWEPLGDTTATGATP